MKPAIVILFCLVVVSGLVVVPVLAAEPVIELIEPIRSEVDSDTIPIPTSAYIIRWVGTVTGDTDITEVKLNDTLIPFSQINARDLVLDGTDAGGMDTPKGIRFEYEMSLAGMSDIKVRLVATDAEGSEGIREFSLVRQRPPANLGRRWALIVGIEDYHDPDINNLTYSVDDTRALYEVLTDPERGGFDPQYVRLLTEDVTDEALQPTRRNILSSLRNWLRGTQPEDMVLFYFSGHGIADKQGKPYLVAVDSTINLLEDTAVSMERVNQLLNEIRAKKQVVILDSCHSGVLLNARATQPRGDIFDPLFTSAEGRMTLASCGADEQTFEDSDKGHGVFSYYLVEGLHGKADSDIDGIVSATEVSNYVYNQVREWAWQNSRKQTPRRVSNIAGEIWLSQNQNVESQRLDSLLRSGLLTQQEYQEARDLLSMASSGMDSQQQARLVALRDLIDAKTSVDAYRATVLRIRELGRFIIQSEPTGAAVFLDGTYSGVTPIALSDISQGIHELELRHQGYVTTQSTVTLHAGQTRELFFRLDVFCELEVISTPAGASITVDGEDTGHTTPTTLQLPAGEYQVTVTFDTEAQKSQALQLHPGQAHPLTFELGYGELIINAEPWGEVYLDGKIQGTTPLRIRNVPAGKHELRIVHETRPDFIQQAVVEEGKTIRVKVQFNSSE